MGCTLKAGKSCSCPASRPKKELRDSDRDISGLLNKGILDKGSCRDIPPCAADCGQDMAAVSREKGRANILLIGALTSGRLISDQGLIKLIKRI